MSIAVPIIRMNTYHSTYTGKKNEVLESFIKDGIKTDIAQGYGQGPGFYVWTKIERAYGHITYLKSNEFLKGNGFPMIIVLNEELNPTEWDVDYEINKDILVSFLLGHWDIFKLIPDNVIVSSIWGSIIISETTHMKMFGEHYIRFVTLYRGKKNNHDIVLKDNEQSTTDGEILGKIFNYLQEKYPEETMSYEKEIFLKIATTKGIALKYVGKRKLKAIKYMIEVEGKWIDGEDAIVYAESHKAA